MTFSSHTVPFERLVDLVEGRLAASERRTVEAHVAACARCAERVARLERVTGLMRTDASVDAPRRLVADAVALFRARGAGPARAPSLVERIVATLTFDSSRLAPAFGVRSSAPTPDSRQLIFSAGPRDIDLRLARVGDAWAISGQVLGECAGGRVRVEGASREASVELNDLCEFALPSLPAGSYRLVLQLPEAEVELPEIDLRAEVG
jgi:anti-sigma factor RsiW